MGAKMDMTIEQRRKYADWLRSFDDLRNEDVCVLLNTLRAMLTTLADELTPKDDKLGIGRGTVESIAAVQSLIEGFVSRERKMLGPMIAETRMRIIEQGDASAIVRMAQAQYDQAVEAAQAASQGDVGGDLVAHQSTPEMVAESLRRRNNEAEPLSGD